VWLACALGGEAGPDFELPASARRVSETASQADVHGDRSQVFVYELSREDARALPGRELWWMRAGAGERSTSPHDPDSPAVAWQRGSLPTELRDAFSTSGPDGPRLPPGLRGAELDFVNKRVEGGWQRALVIDRARRRMYYWRVTW